MGDFSDDSDLIFDDSALEELDLIESAYADGHALPPKTTVSIPGLQQRTLFGAVAPAAPPAKKPVAGPSRDNASVAKVKLVKRWDPASFAKHGWSKKNAAAKKALVKGKGKGKGKASMYEDWDEEDVLDDDDAGDDSDGQEFYVDPNYDPNAPLLPIKWPPDPVASKTWVYPSSADKPLRTYQFNICHVALFENTLVSLPTGLGKTFIAAVVMLNFYRWYPKGKIIFLAPSRPLVAQQVIACHYIAGIPQGDCVELTGSTAPKLRAIGWATKRVIYSTPQTVENDLAKGRLDPRDVTCLVIDEAHRASGDYAYCGVVRYMMSRNQHFRILALTATPGSNGDAVQEVVDNLHIGNIQVRSDESLDIRQYIHKKSYNLLVLPPGDDLSSIRDRWSNLMRPYMAELLKAKLIFQDKPEMLSPFAVLQANVKIRSMPGGNKANGRFFPIIKQLSQMARAMDYLLCQSLTEFDSILKDLEQSGNKKMAQTDEFRDVVRDVRTLRARQGYVGHPKMEKLRSMCYDHFLAAENDVDEYTGEKRQTRVMVFCNFRAVVEEIVACLNTKRPLIKATPFVGQASSKGSKGMSQKEQIETIKKFKAGVYNVMVASSIGEEGLDIGEIDLIVCYEANKSPIRMLQRVGRTGRARDGHIIVLMTEGREEGHWKKAKEQHETVQNALTSNKVFELYVDGDRMLPPYIKPEVEKVEIKAQKINLATMTMAGETAVERKVSAQEKKAAQAEAKRKRDPKRNVPEDAFEGFRTAGQLAIERKALRPPSPSAAQVARDRKSAVYLTESQEIRMRERWYFSGDTPVKATTFDPYSLPFERGASGSALVIPRHSTRHADLLTALRITEHLDDSHPSHLDEWHEKMSKAFDMRRTDLFDVWPEAKRGTAPAHMRIRRAAQIQEPPPSSFLQAPEPTRTVPKALSAAVATTSPPAGLPSSPAESLRSDAVAGPPHVASPIPDSPPPSPPPEIVPPRKAQLARPAPGPAPASKPLARTKSAPSKPVVPDVAASARALPATAPTRPRPAPPPPQTIYHQEQIGSEPRASLDPFNVLSSDDEAKPALKTGTPARLAAYPNPSTSYSDFDFDDGGDYDGLCMSDTQLLQGAIMKGRSKSPQQQQTAAVPADIVIDASEDEDVVVVEAPRISTQLSARPPNACSSAARHPPQAARSRDSSSPAVVPDSDEHRDEIFALPPRPPSRPPAYVPSKSAQRPAPAVATPAAVDEDEYSFFDIDMPDDMLESALAVSTQAIVRGRPLPKSVLPTTVEQQEADNGDDSLIMMPPPVPMPSAAKPRPRPPPSRNMIGRLPSSASSDRPAAPRPATQVASSVDDSPVVAPGWRAAAAGKRPNGGRGNPPTAASTSKSRFRPAVDSSVSPGPVPAKSLNRLRRGRVEIDSDGMADYEQPLNDVSPPPAKKKKVKRGKMSEKEAARNKLFDIEAVNSSASGTEASSEAYNSEDSDDRRFVASEDGEVADVSPGQAQFYRDSLLSQAPGFSKNSTRFGGLFRRRSSAHERVIDQGTPMTPNSQDQWSYDSFCVPDDAEIEMDESRYDSSERM